MSFLWHTGKVGVSILSDAKMQTLKFENSALDVKCKFKLLNFTVYVFFPSSIMSYCYHHILLQNIGLGHGAVGEQPWRLSGEVILNTFN